MAWKKIRNEKDYKVWRKGSKTIAVHRGIYVSPSGRRYRKNGMAKAKAHMRRNK